MSAAPIRAVCFDVFGTLVNVTERRQPYRKLMEYLATLGHSAVDESEMVMSTNLGIAELPAYLGYELSADRLAFLQEELRIEFESIRLYDDAARAIETVQALGLKTALCSNLAAPYGPTVRALIPAVDHYVFSFEVGAVKPDPQIFARLCEVLDCRPEEVLMVGDTKRADYDGPSSYGMQAWHLARGRESTAQHVIDSLDDLAQVLVRYRDAREGRTRKTDSSL
jgi:HAD superfamily hydrolase (TIGR01549 family)